jgi:hypothetical protein
MKKLLLILSLFVILSCKDNSPEIAANEYVGTWKLVSFCKSNGSNPCTTTVVPLDKGVFISFTNDGKFEEFYENTKPFEYSFFGCFGRGEYEVLGTDLRIVTGCMSSIKGYRFPVVSVDSKRLVLAYYFGNSEYTFERQ